MQKLLKNNLLLILILLVAASLRLYRISAYMTFLGDEGRDVLIVYNILHGHLTLLGPTASVGGFFLGPIYYYFMAPFLWLFNYNPVGPAVMVALFGIATVFLIYKIALEFFNQKTALIAAFLYSISPLVITYSRSSWNPNLMPFFSLLTLYILYRAVLSNRWQLFVVVGFLLGILMQLHYLATFIGVIIAVYIFILGLGKYKKIIRDYLIVLAGFLVGWSPFLAFEVRHGFNNIRSIFTFIFLPSGKDAMSESSGFFSTVYDTYFRVFGRLIAGFPPIEKLKSYPNSILSLWEVVTLVLAIASCAFLFYKTYRLFRAKKKDLNKYLLLSVWLVFGVLLFGFYRKQIYDYYFGFMFPLPFFIIAIALDHMFNKKKLYMFASILIFVGLIGVNVVNTPLQYEPNNQLNQMKTISKLVLDKSDGKPFNFGITSTGNSDYAYRYFFTVWHAPVVEIKNFADDPSKTSVTNQLFVVCETLPCHPLGNPAWQIAGFGQAEIDGLWNVSVVQVAKLSHYKGK